MTGYAQHTDLASKFSASKEAFEGIVTWLDGDGASEMTHAELEERLAQDGRELLRQLFQDHLELRGVREKRLVEVVGADGVARRQIERGHPRLLRTIFGEVQVTRIAYRQKGHSNLHPLDGHLNLPAEKHSHGLRRLAAIESARDSFDSASGAIGRVTGAPLGKRQIEELARRTAQDFDAFYEQRPRHLSGADDVLALSCDGKGVVMRLEDLREETRRKAKKAKHKLKTRLSRGETRNRKRMAQVAAVYDIAPAPRSALDVMGPNRGQDGSGPKRPKPRAKWLTASVADEAHEVIAKMFDEAQRRDPQQQRPWVVLVDGLNHQLALIEAEAQKRDLDVVIIVDFIHVLEYLWKAAWCFFEEGDPRIEQWVAERARAVLEGRSSHVAGGIRRKATCLGLSDAERKGVDACAKYLINKRPYIDYSDALRRGWPIATGVIEGACRHLIMDRMALTGARWSLVGAEAVLKLRALLSNGDFESYWDFHLSQEHRRLHERRYWPPPDE
jgi:hypothetical protein